MKSKQFQLLILLQAVVIVCLLICTNSCVNNSKLPEVIPDLTNAIYKNPAYPVEERISDLLSRMTLDEKIGQMTQVAKDYLPETPDIKKYFLGSILSGGGMAPSPNTLKGWADMYDLYQQLALKTRLAIPVIYGIDAVHGHNTLKDAVIFPHNIGMGCTFNPALVEEACRITALEVAATGLDWTFSPCIAVVRDERWGRTYEGFGETPEIQEMMAGAAVRGYQGTSFGSDRKRILACAKHYMGDGGTKGGVDRGNTECSEEELRRIHLPGYIKAVEAGVGSVMVSFSSWNGKMMHGNRYLITDVLKNELKFDGIVISDWQAINLLPGNMYSDVTTSINAGLDMIMVPDDYRTFISTLKSAIEKGDISMERIDDAASRILRIKFRMGLFEYPFTDRSLFDVVGSQEHRNTARECVRRSVVLLKNKDNILPLSSRTGRIHVAGSNADDIGNQCGGWTMTWQGMSGNITKGTSILAGLKKNAPAGTKITYSPDGTGAAGADVGIVVAGEKPYAEMAGDKSDLSLPDSDLNAIKNIRASGIPVIVILISGRPMIVEPYIAEWDGFLAAWLPGTEGDGVADVVYGSYNPAGRLSHSWPRNMKQIPINQGDKDYDPLFAYGSGLSYPGQK